MHSIQQHRYCTELFQVCFQTILTQQIFNKAGYTNFQLPSVNESYVCIPLQSSEFVIVLCFFYKQLIHLRRCLLGIYVVAQRIKELLPGKHTMSECRLHQRLLYFQSSFLQGRKQETVQYLGCCHQCWKPGWNSCILTSAWPGHGRVVI